MDSGLHSVMLVQKKELVGFLPELVLFATRGLKHQGCFKWLDTYIHNIHIKCTRENHVKCMCLEFCFQRIWFYRCHLSQLSVSSCIVVSQQSHKFIISHSPAWICYLNLLTIGVSYQEVFFYKARAHICECDSKLSIYRSSDIEFTAA